MRLAFPELSTVLELQTGSFCGVIIEEPALFYRLVSDLWRQSGGADGMAVLSRKDVPVPISKNLELLQQFIPFELNRKTLLNRITAELERTSAAPEFFQRSNKLLAELENYLYDLAFTGPADLEFQKLSVSAILKAAGMQLREDQPSLAEKLLDYLRLVAEYEGEKVFCFINLRSWLTTEAAEKFTAEACSAGHRLLLLDNREYPLLVQERRTIIDGDLCEI